MDTVTRLRELERRLSEEGENPALLLNLARTWRKLNNPQNALRFVERSIQLDARIPLSWNTLGATLMDLQDWERAEAAFRQALKLDPKTPHAEDNLALALRQQTWRIQEAAQRANWGPYERNGQRLLSMHRGRMAQTGKGLLTPFSVLGFHLSGAEQRAAAESQAREFLKDQGIPVDPDPPQPRAEAGRVRIGYLSADFRNNAAGHLLHRLFGSHDRDRFEVFGLSYGPEDGSEFRREIKAGAEHFVELRQLDDEAAASRIRELEIDLIVDLMGFAGNNRAGILARRPAPVQVLWLGYCMTTGAPWIDAFIADETALPASLEPAFSERVIRLPHSYQVYSGQAFDRTADRSRFGLPEDAMVYCCFNMPEKVDPAIWSKWMQILSAVPGSVLWMLVGDEETTTNYRKRAQAAGVAPERIIPARLLPKREHLARVAQADLFLDTPLCNAHTTASDALWAGVPVLTFPGELFAQRVAASVCQSAGLPDLVVRDLDEYVATAVSFGKDRANLESLRKKLADARVSAPLFDVPGFARSLEAVFEDLADRHAPDRAAVSAATLPLVLVLGSWRSGTSALAGVLHHLGIHMGTEFASLSHASPHRETWEPSDLFEIVWASLREPDMEPLRKDEDTAAALQQFLDRHESRARQAGHSLFGVKHPALSMLAPLIKEIWPNVLTVRTERDLDECWNSMQRIGWEWPEEPARVGLARQQKAAATHCEGPAFVYPAFIENAEDTVDRLIDYLPVKPTTEQRRRAIDSLGRKT